MARRSPQADRRCGVGLRSLCHDGKDEVQRKVEGNSVSACTIGEQAKGHLMGHQERATKIMKISEEKHEFSGVVDDVYRNGTRVLIEKSGAPVAAIISAADLDRFVLYEQQRAERFNVIDAMREAFKDVPPEEIERGTDRIIARIREENRAAREAMAATG
jgi:prevent-host-death family protein